MRILIAGAGVAGLSAAVNLGALGHEVTVVEIAPQLRTSGSPIDIRGHALEVTERMGLLDQIRSHATDYSARMHLVDLNGRFIARAPIDELGDTDHDVEIPREDLATLLAGALNPSTVLVFGDSVDTLTEHESGIDVAFSSGTRRRYDLVVGADGLHSKTRRLVFGPESQFLHFLGFYFSLSRMRSHEHTDDYPMYNYPGHAIGRGAYNGKAFAQMIFRSSWIDYDYHNLDAQKQLLVDAFAGHHEWEIPELLNIALADPDLYFDSVSQIRMNTWHRGHVVLLGDAAHCASPLSGRGTSLALTGSWFLAEALREHPDDLQLALARYEIDQRPQVTYSQATAEPTGDFLIPATQREIDERNRQLSSAGRSG